MGLPEIIRRHGRIGEQQQCIFASGLFLEDPQRAVARVRQGVDRQIGQPELQLHVQIVRLQFPGFSQQRKSLRDLTLVIVDDAQTAGRHRVSRGCAERVAIFGLGLLVLPGGKIIVGSGEILILCELFFCGLFFCGLFFGAIGTCQGRQAQGEGQQEFCRSRPGDHRLHL